MEITNELFYLPHNGPPRDDAVETASNRNRVRRGVACIAVGLERLLMERRNFEPTAELPKPTHSSLAGDGRAQSKPYANHPVNETLINDLPQKGETSLARRGGRNSLEWPIADLAILDHICCNGQQWRRANSHRQ